MLKPVQNKNNSSGSFIFQQAKLPVQLCVAKYCAFLRCSLAVSYLGNIVNLSNTWVEVEIKLNQCTNTALLLWIDDYIAIRKLSVNQKNINIKACLINIIKTSSFNYSCSKKGRITTLVYSTGLNWLLILWASNIPILIIVKVYVLVD